MTSTDVTTISVDPADLKAADLKKLAVREGDDAWKVGELREIVKTLNSDVERLVAEFADPTNPPGTDGFDHRPQFTTGCGQHVLHLVAVGMPLHDAGPHELVQPLRQQGGRHSRHAPAQLVEALAAKHQFADDE